MANLQIVLIGLCVLVVAAAIVLWRGGPLEKKVALAGFLCWVACAAAQILTGSNVAPVVLADVAVAAVLLWFLLRHHRAWLYLLFAVEAARLILHGAFFQLHLAPAPAYRLLINATSFLMLVIVVVQSLLRRRTT